MTYTERIPAGWRNALGGSIDELDAIEEFVGIERSLHPGEIYPPDAEVFRALELTSPDSVRAVMVGMDPYHRPGQAMGLAFSLRPGAKPYPPSLRNILVELERDLGEAVDRSGDLTPWAERGVLMLNRALTVQRAKPGSHLAAWEPFTRRITRSVAQGSSPIVFMLWGARAQEVAGEVRAPSSVQRRSHPSGLSAHINFTDTGPFRDATTWLVDHGGPIDWRL